MLVHTSLSYSFYDSITYRDCSNFAASLEEGETTKFKVYPNSVVDYLQIELDSEYSTIVKFLDLSGKTVKSIDYIAGSEIYVGDLANGSYHIIIESNNGTLHKYLVVNH